MAARPPLRIWRALLLELLRLLALTTVALVAVVAFAAAVKPLSEGKIGPAQALHFMGLASVPMLQFALPFAAGFAATITFHRFASENEATAAMAGGIPHRSLLVPALVAALALFVSLLALTRQVIPAFLHSMERVIAANATETVIGSLQQGENITLGGWLVHARSATTLGPDPRNGARQHAVLEQVLAVQPGDQGVDVSVAARQVGLWMYDAEDDTGAPVTLVQLVFRDATSVQRTPEGGREMFNQQTVRLRPIPIPSAFDDDPKFFSASRMREVERDPTRLAQVDARRRALAMRIAEHDMIAAIDASLELNQTVELIDREGSRVVITGAGLAREGDAFRVRPADPGQRVAVDWALASGAARQQLADRATISVESAGEGWMSAGIGGGALVLELERVTILEGGEAASDRRDIAYGGLTTPARFAEAELQRPLPALLAKAQETARDTALEPLAQQVRRAAREVQRRTDELRREILSKRHERWAFAAAGLLMVLCGAVVGLKMRDAMPLPVYLWSFFPALAAIITITAGQTLVYRQGAAGLPLLWGGIALLAGFTIYEFRRLARH